MSDEKPETVEERTAPLNVAGAVPQIVSDDVTDDLKILLGEFEGPLDLLLHLIRQEHVSIYDIPVARITDEYLRYLRVMQEMDIAVAGDFLVMAATLIELKTKMLLPRDPLAPPEEEEDPRSDLVNQLLEYQKYKAAAQMLWSRATVEQAVFKRAELETDKNNPEVAVGLFDLLKVFQDILARHKEEALLEIEREEISMAEMLERLRNMVMSAGELNLRVFFERAKSRRELVLAFLSVLELVRTTEVRLFQRETFGEEASRELAAMVAEAEQSSTAEQTEESDDGELYVPQSESERAAVIEALIFVSEEPLSAKAIADVLKEDKEVVGNAITALVEEFNARNGGLQLREVAGGWQFATRPEYHEHVRAFLKTRPSAKLSIASLETLAVIAYRQPVTVPEILEIRGVQSPSAIKTLLDKKLIVAKGRKETVGRPMMYGTSKEFLLQFGLKDLSELPSVEDFHDLSGGS